MSWHPSQFVYLEDELNELNEHYLEVVRDAESDEVTNVVTLNGELASIEEQINLVNTFLGQNYTKWEEVYEDHPELLENR